MKINVTAQNFAVSITEGGNTLLDFKVDGYQFSADATGLIASVTKLLEPNTGAEDTLPEDTLPEDSKPSDDTGCVIHAVGPDGKLKHYRSLEDLLVDILP